MTCPVCSHEQRTDLDVRLAQGVAISALAAQFDLPEQALRRHQDDHLRNLPVKLTQNPTSVLLDLERVETEAWGVVEMGKGIPMRDNPAEWLVKPNPIALISALTEIRHTKETQVRLAKELAVFRKDMVPREQFERMIGAVVKTLQEFPAALNAVEAVIAELEL